MDRRKILLILAVLVALIGAGLVFLYAKGADNRAASAFDPVTVLVASEPIAVGESFDDAAAAGKVASREVPSNMVLTGSSATADPFTGKTANTNIAVGEQLLEAKFGGSGSSSALAIPAGMVAISVELTDTARVAGFVDAGSEVAVWLTSTEAGDSAGTQTTRLLLPSVNVIAAGSTSTMATTSTDEEGGTVTEQMPRTLLTLAVEQEDAERIKLANSLGELSFGLLTEKSDVKPGRGVTPENIFR